VSAVKLMARHGTDRCEHGDHGGSLPAMAACNVRYFLPRIVGRAPEATPMVVAVIGGKYETLGLVRTVKHRDHTRSYALTNVGRAALEAGEK
jgi:hypothetical protein